MYICSVIQFKLYFVLGVGVLIYLVGKVLLAMSLSKGFNANFICIRTVCLFADALFGKNKILKLLT